MRSRTLTAINDMMKLNYLPCQAAGIAEISGLKSCRAVLKKKLPCNLFLPSYNTAKPIYSILWLWGGSCRQVLVGMEAKLHACEQWWTQRGCCNSGSLSELENLPPLKEEQRTALDADWNWVFPIYIICEIYRLDMWKIPSNMSGWFCWTQSTPLQVMKSFSYFWLLKSFILQSFFLKIEL